METLENNTLKDYSSLKEEFDHLLKLYANSFNHHLGVYKNSSGYIAKGALENIDGILEHLKKLIK